MTRNFKLGAGTALVSTLIALPAFAELTAQDVWNDQKTYLQNFGYTVTATESMSGDTLTVSDLSMAVPIPEEDFAATLTMPSMTYTTQGDGSVAIGLPATTPLVVSVAPPGEDPVRIVVELTSDKFDMTASGDADNLTYTYDADNVAMTLTEVMVEGLNAVPGIASFKMTMQDIDGTTSMRVGNARNMEQSLSLGDLGYDFKFNDPDSGDKGQFAGNIAAVSYGGTMTMPLEIDMADPAALFKGGFEFDGTYTAGAGSTNFNVDADGDIVSGALSSTGSSMAFALLDQVISYEIKGQGNSVAVQGGDLPFPVQFAMDETRVEFAMPLAKAETDQPFGLGLTLGNFTMADLLWSIFDPAGQLARDPATIDLDLVGSVKLLVDLFDETQMMKVERGEMMPGELQTLSLSNLVIDAVGAKLTGMGDFVFDNTDLTTYDGLPKPVGEVDLELTGANALIDKLIGMGFVEEQQAMGARMMMSMFAVPAGDDVLKSKIEMNEQGQVLANGQRIK